MWDAFNSLSLQEGTHGALVLWAIVLWYQVCWTPVCQTLVQWYPAHQHQAQSQKPAWLLSQWHYSYRLCFLVTVGLHGHDIMQPTFYLIPIFSSPHFHPPHCSIQLYFHVFIQLMYTQMQNLQKLNWLGVDSSCHSITFQWAFISL